MSQMTIEEIARKIPPENVLEALRRLHILNVHEIYLHQFYTPESIVEFLLDDNSLTAYPGISSQILTEIYDPDSPTVFSGIQILLKDFLGEIEQMDDEEEFEFAQWLKDLAQVSGIPDANNRYNGFPEYVSALSLRAAIKRLQSDQL